MAFGSVERKEQRWRKQRREGRERRSLGGEKNTEGIKYIYIFFNILLQYNSKFRIVL